MICVTRLRIVRLYKLDLRRARRVALDARIRRRNRVFASRRHAVKVFIGRKVFDCRCVRLLHRLLDEAVVAIDGLLVYREKLLRHRGSLHLFLLDAAHDIVFCDVERQLEALLLRIVVIRILQRIILLLRHTGEL